MFCRGPVACPGLEVCLLLLLVGGLGLLRRVRHLGVKRQLCGEDVEEAALWHQQGRGKCQHKADRRSQERITSDDGYWQGNGEQGAHQVVEFTDHWWAVGAN